MKVLKPQAIKQRMRYRETVQLPENLLNCLKINYQIEPQTCSPLAIQDRVHDSSSYLLIDGKKRDVLKIYKTFNKGALIHETALVRHLQQKGLPVPIPRQTAEGKDFVFLGQDCINLTPFVKGYSYRQYYMTLSLKKKLTAQSAKFLASMHQITNQILLPGQCHWPGTEGRKQNALGLIDAMKARDAKRFKDLVERIDALMPLWTHLEENRMSYNALPKCIVHEDFGPYNALYKKGKLCGVIDFMDAHLDWRVKDVIFSLMMFCRTRHFMFHPDLVQYFMRAYRRIVQLEEIEFELMSDLFCLKRFNELPEFMKAAVEEPNTPDFYIQMLHQFADEIQWHQKNKKELKQLIQKGYWS